MSVKYFVWHTEKDEFEIGAASHFSGLSALCQKLREPGNRDQVWIDMNDSDSAEIALLETEFGIDGGVLRDLIQNSPLPRMHSYKHFDYVLLHRLFYNFETQSCDHRSVALFRGQRVLITVHRSNLSRLFEHIASLVKGHPEGFLSKGNSRIFLHLLEGLIADYGPIVNRWQEDLEKIEESILRGSKDSVIEKILQFKKMVVTMKKSLLPQRHALVQVYERSQLNESEESNRPYLKNVSEEVSNLIDELEGIGYHAASIFEIYAASISLEMSRSSHQLNTSMQRLSVMTAIFLPLTFIVGVYGMNIQGIPELSWPKFYYFLWGVMVAIVLLLLFLFKKFKWY